MASEEEDVLCESCSRIDFEQLFEPYDWNEPEKRDVESFWRWGRHVEIEISDDDEPTCRLCRMLIEMSEVFPLFEKSGPLNSLWAFPRDWAYHPKHSHRKDEPSERETKRRMPVVVGALPLNHLLAVHEDLALFYMCETKQLGYLLSCSGESIDGTDFAQAIEPNGVSLRVIAECLDICKAFHCHQPQSQRPIPSLELIDCESRRVVDGTPDMEYVALSYIWGKTEKEEEEEEAVKEKKKADTATHLEKNLPPVIDDAIRIVLALGRKYLWVDRYCIRHKDHSHKADQIRNMDIIYNRAELTIFAMAGDGPEYGLCGVGRNGRYSQWQWRVNGKSYVTIPGNPNGDHLSMWTTRGWTLQEAYLSRRRLVFAKHQAYFECSDMLGLESIAVPLEHAFCWEDRKVEGSSYPLADICSPDGIGEIIEEYSRRKLSYDCDKLNAISGLLRAWSQTNEKCWSYWGLPLVSQKGINPRDTLDNQFGRALRWCVSVWGQPTPMPRMAFPSWSWLCSPREIKYFGSLWLPNTTTTLREKVHDMKVWIERKDGSLVKLIEFQVEGGFDLGEEEWTSHVHLDCWVAKVGPFHHYSSPKCNEKWWQHVPTSQEADPKVDRTRFLYGNDSTYWLPIRNSKTGEEWRGYFYEDTYYYGIEDELLNTKFDCIVLEDWMGPRVGLILEHRDGLNRRVGVLVLDPPPKYDENGDKVPGSVSLSFAQDVENFLPLERRRIRLS